jgi:hypothetical protein
MPSTDLEQRVVPETRIVHRDVHNLEMLACTPQRQVAGTAQASCQHDASWGWGQDSPGDSVGAI